MPRARARGRANLYCDDDAFARAAACLCIAETDRVVRTRTEDFPQVQRRSGDPRRAKVELQISRQVFSETIPGASETLRLLLATNCERSGPFRTMPRSRDLLSRSSRI